MKRIVLGTVVGCFVLAASLFSSPAEAHGPYGRYGFYGGPVGRSYSYTSGYAPFTGGYAGVMVPPYNVYYNRYTVPYGAGYSGGWQPYQGFYRQGPYPQVGLYLGY